MCKSFIMKNFALNLFFFLSALVLNAQEYKQLDLFTKRQILNGNFKKQDINVLVKGDLNAIKKAAEVNGALYKYGYGNIAAVNVPLEKFDAFSNAEGIEFIENVDLPIVPLAENSVILSNVLLRISIFLANPSYKKISIPYITWLEDLEINHQMKIFFANNIWQHCNFNPKSINKIWMRTHCTSKQACHLLPH